MMNKHNLRRVMRRWPLALVAGTTALALHACGTAEAEPRADPAKVQAYLEQVEAEERLITGEAERKEAHERTIRNMVEGAAVRAPSDAAINRLETVVIGKL